MTTTTQKPMLTRRQLEYIRLPERKMVKDLNTALKRWLIDSAGQNKAEASRKLRGKPERYQYYQNEEDGILLEYTGHLRNEHYNAWIYSVRQYLEGELRIDVSAMVQEFRPNRANNHTFTANLVAISQCSWEREEEQIYQSQTESLYSLVDQYRHQPRRIEPNGTPLNIHELMKGNNVIAIPWQHDNKPDPSAMAIAEEWAENMDIAIIDHSGHRSISRELTAPEHILGWNDAKAAVLTKYGNPDAAIQVIPVPVEETETAREVISRHGDTNKDHIAFTAAREAIRGMVSSIPESEIALQDIQESFAHSSVCHHEQRVFVLEDQLKEAQDKITEHESTIESLSEQQDTVPPNKPDDQESETEPETKIRTLVDAIIELSDSTFPNLTFMDTALDNTATFNASSNEANDILQALESLEKLASALANTPNKKVGNWQNYFNNLTGWKYRVQDSEFTMGRYGKYRQFTHNGKAHTINRHLTCTSRTSGVQIYFDTDDDYGKQLAIAYIGPHLPYVSQ